MATEIERKFKVTSNDFKKLATPLYCIQGYVNGESNTIIRIRIINNKGYLTLKGKNAGISRLEFEYEIPLKDANLLLTNFCSNKLVEKNRFIISYKNTLWEVDEFLGSNLGLVIAEVELKSETQKISKPEWIGKEVSNQTKYYNSNLVNHPFISWSKN